MELLAPAGNMEKMLIALHYGADAVYLGLADFSLRSMSRSFSEDELIEAIQLARSLGRKAYITLNILPHNRDLEAMREHLRRLAPYRPDAVIVSDPGVFEMAAELLPDSDLHISTQANITNAASARFWKRMGASRIVLAREVSLEEIKQIRDAVDIEIEAFVHGSICIAYSGRCYLSSFLTNRSANEGECANSCRWNYTLMRRSTQEERHRSMASDEETCFLREEKRPDEYMPVFENDRGTYIMSSKDLCMIEHIPALIEAGVTSFKIEGRNKGVNYAAGVVKVYREALDAAARGEHTIDPRWIDELNMFSSRGYTTGMYFGPHPDQDYHHDESRIDRRTHDFAGIVRKRHDRQILLAPRTVLRPGEQIQFLSRGIETDLFTITALFDEDGRSIPAAKNESPAWLQFDRPVPEVVEPMDILRRPCQMEAAIRSSGNALQPSG
jgi:putative protease